MNSVWETTIIWGFWHLSIVSIIFKYKGMEPTHMIVGFIMFLGSIFLTSVLHAWVNLRSKSVLPNVLLHGLRNWWPLVIPVLFGESLAQISTIGGYIFALLILQWFYSSSSYFIEK